MSDLTDKATAVAGNPAPPKNRAHGVIPSVGARFGRLVVIDNGKTRRDSRGGSRRICKCRCDCGKEICILANSLNRGRTKSCGCLRAEVTHEQRYRHGGKGSRLYNIWCNIMQRCDNRLSRHFKDYGGRGIRVCDEWKRDFTAFRDWAMAYGYADNLSIDRIDNDGNYEPSNCRWADGRVQVLNRRNTVKIELNGVIKTLSEFCKEMGFPYDTAKCRYYRGSRGAEIFKPIMGKSGSLSKLDKNKGERK